MTILNQIKEMVEVDVEEELFDTQLLSYINSGISYLKRNNIPITRIDEDSELTEWNEIEEDESIADYKLPKLVLQPLVENAIYHGMEGMDGDGEIDVRGKIIQENSLPVILLSVEDNGFGMTEDKARALLEKTESDYSSFSSQIPSRLILPLMLRSAEQETPMPTGQDAPWRGRRTTRMSCAKYLPPNCAPSPRFCASFSNSS